MKNKITGRFSAIISVQSAVIIVGKVPFRVIFAFAEAMGDKSRLSQAKLFCLFAWIFAVVSVFAESFPNRPTASEMEEIVILGKECILGMNERCWATQYQTNPVQYQVSPFTNNSCWYLDQSLMGQIASNARSLVSYYVNPDTVYNGTTNITMLTVTGVWADLDIGNGVDQFTLTPASGTNPPTYGDSPWRIYQVILDERYDVLSVCKVLPAMPYWGGVSAGTNFGAVISRNVKYGGTIQYQHPINYIYHGAMVNIGQANGTLYDIEMSAAAYGGSASDWQIIMGKATPYLVSSWGVQDVGNGVVQFDTNPSTNISAFSADLIFSANAEYVRILNCKADTSIGCNNINSSYTETTINISADLDEANLGTIFFEWWQVLEYPFQYVP